MPFMNKKRGNKMSWLIGILIGCVLSIIISAFVYTNATPNGISKGLLVNQLASISSNSDIVRKSQFKYQILLVKQLSRILSKQDEILKELKKLDKKKGDYIMNDFKYILKMLKSAKIKLTNNNYYKALKLCVVAKNRARNLKTCRLYSRSFAENNWYLAAIVSRELNHVLTPTPYPDEVDIMISQRHNVKADTWAGKKKIRQVSERHIKRLIFYTYRLIKKPKESK